MAPSSKGLARAMARGADEADFVVELGAGTGAITRELVQRCRPDRLAIVEPDPTAARRLRHLFPHSLVLACCVHEAPSFFASLPDDVLLVSSLPFRSLPRHVIAPTIDLLLGVLDHGDRRRLVQYTYHPRAPFDVPHDFRWRRRERVLRNLPPAGIWELTGRG
ncbi:MAG: rRNA adenine N-6-methyltransferase family protein [Burkholderiaceae bacterium]